MFNRFFFKLQPGSFLKHRFTHNHTHTYTHTHTHTHTHSLLSIYSFRFSKSAFTGKQTSVSSRCNDRSMDTVIDIALPRVCNVSSVRVECDFGTDINTVSAERRICLITVTTANKRPASGHTFNLLSQDVSKVR